MIDMLTNLGPRHSLHLESKSDASIWHAGLDCEQGHAKHCAWYQIT